MYECLFQLEHFCIGLNILAVEAMGMRTETLNSIKDEELQTFRREVKQMCCQAVKTRDKWDKSHQALFHYPPVLDINPDLPMNTVKQFQQSKSPPD